MVTEAGEQSFVCVAYFSVHEALLELLRPAYFRHLGCEKAVEVIRASKIFGQCRVPVNWCELIQETITGTQRDALDGVVANSRNLCDAVRRALNRPNKTSSELLVVGGDHRYLHEQLSVTHVNQQK